MGEPGFEDVLAEGREDLIDARQLSVAGKDARSMAIYHARQAAEKFITAFAKHKGVQPGPDPGLKAMWNALGEKDDALGKIVDSLVDDTVPENADILLERVNNLLKLMDFVYKNTGIVPGELPDVPEPKKEPVPVKRRVASQSGQQKRFFVCNRCGVNIPFSHHTARGRVICPHCGRLMRMVY